MDMKHERKTNTAYVKTLDLELSGNQINLSERTKSREQLNQRKKLARSLRPCTLRRPMSATPYRDVNRSKRLPPWSRPQSAGSVSLRRNKLAAKFSDSTLLDPDYCPEFGATYTLSNSQLLHSLMGSCSINEGMDSDTTPTPSPQPSLGDTIRAAAQLEPGLTSKPPLPPSSTPQPRGEPSTTPTPTNNPEVDSDDIIALKFQRWFPDAIPESEIIQRTTLTITPFDKQKDDGDQSDAGTSITDGPLSDRDFGEKMTNNISTFVKKSKILNNVNERPEKGKTKNNSKRNKPSRNDESPQIVINEPDLYGCNLVTEEFACDRNVQSLTPDCDKTLNKPNTSGKLKNNYKRLSLSDLNDVRSGSLCNSRSLSVQVYSDSEMFKDELPNANITSKDLTFHEGHSDCELNRETESKERKLSRNQELRNEFAAPPMKNENYLTDNPNVHETYTKNLLSTVNDTFKNDRSSSSFCETYLQVHENDYNCKQLEITQNSSSRNDFRNNIASPSNFEVSSSQYRFTSTPVNTENKEESLSESHKEESKSNNFVNEEFESKLLDEASNAKSFKHFSNLSPPIKLLPEEDEIYHDHFNSQRDFVEDELTKTYDKQNIQKLDNQTSLANIDKEETKSKEKHAHFSCPSESNMSASETRETDYGKSSRQDKDFENWGRSYSPLDSTASDRQRRESDCSLRSCLEKKRVENSNKECGRRNSKCKEVSRSASISHSHASKPNASILKQTQIKESCAVDQNSKRKMKRSMSYDAATMREISEKDSGVSSYEDIVTMIKVLEKEDLESPVMQYKSNAPSNPLPEEDSQKPGENFSNLEQSSNAKAILNFLDQVDKGTMPVLETERSQRSTSEENTSARLEPPGSSRLGSLMNADTSDLAQRVMILTLQLEEKTAVCRALEERHKQSVDLLKKQKTERDETDRRHQKFIDQLLKEKRQLAVQYETAMREMEGKHENAVKVIEERHKVEMKKAQERFNAAEKIRRDKWIDTKTKKIKELTVKGLEPELERMAAAHQEELAELRRVHQRQLTEVESAWVRRTAALRENEALERQAAIQHEREASRHRLEQEMNQVEKSYQEQRRRLLDEVRQEKELLQRQSERIIAEKQAEIAKQVDEAKLRYTEKLAEHDQLHKEDIERLKENQESEKQAWISRQKGGLEEKEAVLREELKRERDRQIELVIRRLDSEATAKEQAIENKIKRLKESYDSEVNDLDATLKELRVKLKETRAELQKSEDLNAALTSQLSQAQNEVTPIKLSMEKLRREYSERMQQTEQQMAKLQKELTESKQSFQEQVSKIHNDKEKQLHQVYTRVKEAINKKEEALILVTKQRDAALEQCDRLEKLLEAQRNHSLKL